MSPLEKKKRLCGGSWEGRENSLRGRGSPASEEVSLEVKAQEVEGNETFQKIQEQRERLKGGRGTGGEVGQVRKTLE